MCNSSKSLLETDMHCHALLCWGMQRLRRGCRGRGSRQLLQECALGLLRRHDLTVKSGHLRGSSLNGLRRAQALAGEVTDVLGTSHWLDGTAPDLEEHTTPKGSCKVGHWPGVQTGW